MGDWRDGTDDYLDAGAVVVQVQGDHHAVGDCPVEALEPVEVHGQPGEVAVVVGVRSAAGL